MASLRKALIDRRALLAGAVAALAAPPVLRAQDIRDAAGRAVRIPGEVERIFPSGPPAAITLYTLAPEELLGWPRANRPEELQYLDPVIGARAEIGRLTGRGNTTSLETLLQLRPDLIVDIGSTRRTYVELADRVQAQTGIPYALFDGRFDAIVETYRLLGRFTGKETKARELARYAGDAIAVCKARVATIAHGKRPRVYYARGPRGLQTGLGGSINVETIEFMGAQNVAGETRGGLANVSLEQAIAWNPDVIITIDQDFAARVKDDPAWRGVKAVREGRVHLSPKMPFGWVDFPPSVNRLPGLWWLGKILYPSAFPEDLAAVTREFHSMFYHRTPSAAQIADVLAGR